MQQPFIALLIRAVECTPRGTIRERDRFRRRLCIPVRSADNNGVASKIAAAKSKVIRREWSILLQEVAEMAGNSRIEANVETRGAAEVVAEEPEARVELLEDNGLRLNFADLFGYNSGKF